MSTTSNLWGIIALLTYTAAIFKEISSPFFSPVESALLVAFTALIANFLTLAIVDWFGRKFVLFISLILTALGYFVISFHHLYKDRFPNTEWIPFIVMISTIFFACAGAFPIPHIVKIEVLPPKVIIISNENLYAHSILTSYTIDSKCNDNIFTSVLLDVECNHTQHIFISTIDNTAAWMFHYFWRSVFNIVRTCINSFA